MTVAPLLRGVAVVFAAATAAPLQVLPVKPGDAIMYRYALHGETARGYQEAAVTVSLTRIDASSVTIRERSSDASPAALQAHIEGGTSLVLEKHVDVADLPVTLAALDSAMTVAASVPSGAIKGASWKTTLPAAAPGGQASDFPVTVTVISLSDVGLDVHVTGTRQQTMHPLMSGDQTGNAGDSDFARPRLSDPNAQPGDTAATPAPLHVRTTVDDTLHFTDGALSSAEGSLTATGDGDKTIVDLAWSLERQHTDGS